MDKILYCIGFAFTSDHEHVLLIRKNRPPWQAGKLNGVGGKVEPGEEPRTGMIREFQEETGIGTSPEMWRDAGVYFGGRGYTLFIYTMTTDQVQAAVQTTDEALVLLPVADIWKVEVIPNLRWLIPLCLDERVKPFHVFEK